MNKHAGSSSLEDRLKRNRYNIQRTAADLEKKFTQQWFPFKERRPREEIVHATVISFQRTHALIWKFTQWFLSREQLQASRRSRGCDSSPEKSQCGKPQEEVTAIHTHHMSQLSAQGVGLKQVHVAACYMHDSTTTLCLRKVVTTQCHVYVRVNAWQRHRVMVTLCAYVTEVKWPFVYTTIYSYLSLFCAVNMEISLFHMSARNNV